MLKLNDTENRDKLCLDLDIQTVIVNVNTPESTTLALLSALRYTNWGVTIVDCTAEKNRNYFEKLRKHYPFEYKELPLNIHGKTIDRMFRETKHDYLMLLDSDAEILCKNFIDTKYLAKEDCFGAGFVHGPCPMSSGSMKGWKYLYYQERMYIPCTILKTSAMRKALDVGKSFAAKKVYNDFHIPVLARLCYYRFFFQFWQNHEFIFSLPFRKTVNTYKPSMIYYDTGAEVYCYLKYHLNMNFVGYPFSYYKDYIAHYHGITRRLLNSKDNNSTSIDDVEDVIYKSLKEKYNFKYKEFCTQKKEESIL